jgi:hypothetical protein
VEYCPAFQRTTFECCWFFTVPLTDEAELQIGTEALMLRNFNNLLAEAGSRLLLEELDLLWCC